MTPHAHVYAEAQVLDVRARLAVDRLLYAQRVFAVGPFFLQNIIHLEDGSSPNSWLAGLKADLHWMHALSPEVLPSGWEEDMTSLFDSWQNKGSGWKARVKAAARKHHLQEKMMTEVVALHKSAFDVLRKAGAAFQHDPFTATESDGDQICFCGQAFATKRGLLAHQRRKHHVFSAEHPFLQEATCLHCGKFCWTTQRLQQHLAYIPKKLGYDPCFHALNAQGRCADYASVSMPKEVQGLARVEALQTFGPWPEQTTLLARQRCQWEADRAC